MRIFFKFISINYLTSIFIENIFGLRAESLRPLGDSDQDNGIAADAYNEAGDFLNFLDHVARGEQHYIG